MAASHTLAAALAAAALAPPAAAEAPSYAEYCRVITAAAAASPGRFEAVKAAATPDGFATTLRPASEADSFHCAIQPVAGERPLVLACVAYVRLSGLDGWTHECLTGWTRDADGAEVAFSNRPDGRTVILIAPFRGLANVSAIEVLEVPPPPT